MPRRSSIRNIIETKLSHHPLCNNFKDHWLTLFSCRICRGCFFTYLGMALGLILLSVFEGYWHCITEFQIWLALNFLIAPTVISKFFSIEKRAIKDSFRILSGVAFIIGILVFIMLSNLFFRVFILLYFSPGAIYLMQSRQKRIKDICMHCDEFSTIPFCSGLSPYARFQGLDKSLGSSSNNKNMDENSDDVISIDKSK